MPCWRARRRPRGDSFDIDRRLTVEGLIGFEGSVLVVSHDPRIVPFADQVFSLDDGRLSEGPFTASEAQTISETSS